MLTSQWSDKNEERYFENTRVSAAGSGMIGLVRFFRLKISSFLAEFSKPINSSSFFFFLLFFCGRTIYFSGEGAGGGIDWNKYCKVVLRSFFVLNLAAKEGRV